jgi:hypothetical protein
VAIFIGGSGTGGGNVTYSVATNTATTSRTGTLTIAGRIFTITQSASCTYTFNPQSVSTQAASATGTIAVTTQPGCAWSPTTSSSWITLTGAGPGAGNTSYTIAANVAAVPRTGTITIGGTAITVTQAGRPTPPPPTNLRIIR